MAIGSNPPMFPKGLDEFARMEADFDFNLASEMNDIFESLLAIETELGVNLSGQFGSLHSRLFASGNLSKTGVGWRRLNQVTLVNAGTITQVCGTPNELGIPVNFEAKRFQGFQASDLEEGQPLAFLKVRFTKTQLDYFGGSTGSSIYPRGVNITSWRIDDSVVWVRGWDPPSPGAVNIGIDILFWGLR